MKRAKAIYGALLHGYPAPFRHEYGDQMSLMFTEQLDEARRARAWKRETLLWLQAVRDLFTIAPKEHWHVIQQDLRHAVRTMIARPGFAVIAILSLALGIGANTAIFSLWNSVLYGSLPMVGNPEGLVMLTIPTSSGLWRGRWDSRTEGPRPWVSYAEFLDLRDHATSFASLMASESSLSEWQVRIDGGAPEEIRGRLVSGAFFQVLGVRPALGRLFTTREDEGEPPYAVISHAYWRRRLGGRPDVLGRSLTLSNTPVTIVGVAPAGFVGESSGQQPDLWLPLRLQPRVIRGSDWLRETPPDKVMWLHVFGRLKPGVTHAQAEAEANAVLQSNLEAFYGATTEERRREFLDQRLVLSSGARGSSGTLEQFSSSLSMLLAAVGILLLIACANLANLLLARGAARQSEIAIRVSLGASRGRLVRQLVTESLALAAMGGVAAIAVAYALHGVFLGMLQEAEPVFFVDLNVNVQVLTFGLAATLAAAFAFGLLPAWQMTRGDTAAHLKDHSRGAIGSVREMGSSRWLVSVQLALALPLLVAAGLLARTVYNLQNPDLGFRTERLLLAHVSMGELVLDVTRRDNLLREMRARLQRIPGVDTASFSMLGVLTSAMSTATIDVEGSALTSERGRDSALDRVAAGYFTTLGIPLRIGRDIADTDRIDSPRVTIVNEAFVERYFSGRHPLGLRVTTIDDNGGRVPYEVVGVAVDAHTHALRGEVEPRFFVPAEQRPSLGTTRTFLIRTFSSPAPLIPAVREALDQIDPGISVTDVSPTEDRIAVLTAEERTIARLASIFSVVALTLAAIGLYGVLSFGIARRASEIAIRIALGARPRRVVAMILRESFALVVAGLAAGGALGYLGSRLIANRLYGVRPDDPLTMGTATAVLIVVALGAAYLPARRASRVDPIAVLHQG